VRVAYQTERLRLREFADADADRLFRLDRDPEVRRFVGQPAPESAAPYREAIRGRYRSYYERTPGLGFWALETRAGEEFLGWFHLRPAGDYRFAAVCGYGPGDVDLGYRLRREAWGRGYATEMSRLLVARALGELSARRVVACTLAANAGSVRVLEKAGLVREAEVRLPGFEQPAVVYALARPEGPTHAELGAAPDPGGG
jgi:RimJ/RimL family protein N-acetyltransferase